MVPDPVPQPPLRDLAQQRLRDFRKATGGAIPLVGVGTSRRKAEQAAAQQALEKLS